jgi:hypothetical protein
MQGSQGGDCKDYYILGCEWSPRDVCRRFGGMNYLILSLEDVYSRESSANFYQGIHNYIPGDVTFY